MTTLLAESGFKVEKIVRVGKYASAAFIFNRLSRYFRFLRPAEDFAARTGISSLTFRVDPHDIILVFAVRNQQ